MTNVFPVNLPDSRVKIEEKPYDLIVSGQNALPIVDAAIENGLIPTVRGTLPREAYACVTFVVAACTLVNDLQLRADVYQILTSTPTNRQWIQYVSSLFPTRGKIHISGGIVYSISFTNADIDHVRELISNGTFEEACRSVAKYSEIQGVRPTLIEQGDLDDTSHTTINSLCTYDPFPGKFEEIEVEGIVSEVAVSAPWEDIPSCTNFSGRYGVTSVTNPSGETRRVITYTSAGIPSNLLSVNLTFHHQSLVAGSVTPSNSLQLSVGFTLVPAISSEIDEFEVLLCLKSESGLNNGVIIAIINGSIRLRVTKPIIAKEYIEATESKQKPPIITQPVVRDKVQNVVSDDRVVNDSSSNRLSNKAMQQGPPQRQAGKGKRNRSDSNTFGFDRYQVRKLRNFIDYYFFSD